MKKDYQRNVSCKYGAPMGRRSGGMFCNGSTVSLTKVRLDSGGYDQGGAYWGHGEPLYCADGYDDDGFEVVHYFRAPTRTEAKAKVKKINDSVKFYR